MREAVVAAVVCLSAAGAQAQVRVDRNPGDYVDPRVNEIAAAMFGRGGNFQIAGGVVLGGTAAVYLERNGQDVAVAPGAVHLAVAPGGGVGLVHDGVTYRVAMPGGMACPLGRFVARDGVIAYTVPKFIGEDARRAMRREGLVHHRIAKEFDGGPFEGLLRAADFAATVPLQPDIADALSARLNDANGLRGFVVDASYGQEVTGSLINSDLQVRYRVFLLEGSRQVEISGVPLRYFWELDRGGAAGVFAVDAIAQDWPKGTGLSDLARPGVVPSQYDVVNFYQVAGLFRQMHLADGPAFDGFVARACGG